MPNSSEARPEIELPRSMAAFRRLLSSTKSADQFDVIAEAVWWDHSSESPERKSSRDREQGDRLYEARLLEIARRPMVTRAFSKLELRSAQRSAVQSLVHLRSTRAIPVFRSYLESRVGDVRLHGAQGLAWLGFDRLLPEVIKRLRGDDLYALTGTATGAGLAAFHGHASPTYRRQTFAALIPLATGAQRVPKSQLGAGALNQVVEAMTEIAPARAISLFSRAECLHDRNAAVRSILWKLYFLREEGSRLIKSPLDPELVWPLYEASRGGKLRDGMHPDSEQTTGLTLTFAAEADPVRTRREAKAILESINDREWSQLQDLAKEAIRRSRGIPDAHSAYNRFERAPQTFAETAQQVLRAYELAMHVVTDGFPLYFHNLGYNWKPAHAGLRVLKLGQQAAVLREAARLVEAHGPLNTPKSCSRAFEELTPGDSAKLASLAKVFERGNDSILRKVDRYVAVHAPRFTVVR